MHRIDEAGFGTEWGFESPFAAEQEQYVEESGTWREVEAWAGESAPVVSAELFPSGVTLVETTGATATGQEHWDPNATGLPLLVTGPAVRKQKLSPNFTVGELVRSGGVYADVARISPQLVRMLQAIRDRVGKPVYIISGYRSWKRNGVVYAGYGKPPTRSRHCSGQAADIRIPGMSGLDIAKVAIDAWGPHVAVGIGADYAHVDVRGSWAVWTYPANVKSRLAAIRSYRAQRLGTLPKPPSPPTPPGQPVVPGKVSAGRLVVPSVALLTGHTGTPPDLVLGWNDMVNPAAIDVVVHLHGYSDNGSTMSIVTEKLPMSGLDLGSASGGGRTRPTLTILPRGHYFGGTYQNAYSFPALTDPGKLDLLIADAFARFTARTHVSAPRGRLILTAHSGGGSALTRILAHTDPDEVMIFDGLYGPGTAVSTWAAGRIGREIASPSTLPPALRVFYRRGSVKHPGTQPSSEAVGRVLCTLLSAPKAVALRDRFRVEVTTEGHGSIPRRFGPVLLRDAGADVPNSTRFACGPSAQAAAEAYLPGAEFLAWDGFEPEGVQPETFEPEAFDSEAFEAEEFQPEQFEAAGYESEGFEPEGLAAERFDPEQSEEEDLETEDFEDFEDFEPEGLGSDRLGFGDASEHEQFEPEQFEPEDFEPEDIESEQFEPEDFEPGQFESEQFEPEQFEPEQFDPEQFGLEQFESEWFDAGSSPVRLSVDAFVAEEFETEGEDSLGEQPGETWSEAVAEGEDEGASWPTATGQSIGPSVVFPSGVALLHAPASASAHPDHADPNATGLPLLATGPATHSQRLSRNFIVRELVTSGGVASSVARISPKLVTVLQAIRDRVGRPVYVDSGYRSFARNLAVYKKLGKPPTKSRHSSGQAADIRVAGMTGTQLAKTALDAAGPNLAIGIGSNYIHVDVRGWWALWSYIPGAGGATAKAVVAAHRASLKGKTKPKPTPTAIDGRFTSVRAATLATTNPAVRQAALAAGIAFANTTATEVRNKAAQPTSLTSRTRARIVLETGVGRPGSDFPHLDVNPLFGRVTNARFEQAYRTWAENPARSVEPWIIMALWAKEGLTTPPVPPQVAGTSAADARSIWRSRAFFVNMGTDHFLNVTGVTGQDNVMSSAPGSGAAHDVAFRAAVAAQVKAGRLPRDISGEIDAALSVAADPSVTGRFAVTPTDRFFVLSLMLMDAFWRENREAVLAEPKVIAMAPSAIDLEGLTYMRWNMRRSSWTALLKRDMKQNTDPDGTVPSLATWAFHREVKKLQFGQSRANAIRMTYTIPVFRSVYEGP